MKALHIIKYGKFPVLKEIPIPEIGPNELLIKLKYAPINPSDLNFYQGRYGVIKEGFPIVGFQGSGIIEKAKIQQLVGKKVTVTANMTNGTHATYIKSTLSEVIVWPDDADLQKISMAFVNPISCVGMCQIVQKENPKNVLLSAAAGQIGRMMISSLRKKYPSLNIYGLNRTTNKADLLKKLGVNQVILIEDPPSAKLKELEGKTIFYDCVGGNFAGKTFSSLARESKLVCYGRQSGEDLGGIDIGSLYYANKSIRGFWLNNWLKEVDEDEIKAAKAEVVNNFDEIYSSTVRKVFKIEDFMDAYRMSTKDKSEGKILLEL